MVEQTKLNSDAVEGNNVTGKGEKKPGLQELANRIKECLNYYLSGELENECAGLDCGETIGVINRYKEELDNLLITFYNSKEADMETKLRIQKNTFINELNSYNNNVCTSIGF